MMWRWNSCRLRSRSLMQVLKPGLPWRKTQAQVGDILTAEATLEAAAERYPNAHILHAALADLLDEQGRWVEALTAYNLSARSAPSATAAAAAEAGRGRCLLRLARPDEAKLAADQALAHDATNVEAALVRAELALEAQTWKVAFQFAEQAHSMMIRTSQPAIWKQKQLCNLAGSTRRIGPSRKAWRLTPILPNCIAYVRPCSSSGIRMTLPKKPFIWRSSSIPSRPKPIICKARFSGHRNAGSKR